MRLGESRLMVQRKGQEEAGAASVSRRLGVVEGKVDHLQADVTTLGGTADNTKTEMRVLHEAAMAEIRRLAEGVTSVQDGLADLRREVRAGFKQTHDMVLRLFGDHERRITALEKRAGS